VYKLNQILSANKILKNLSKDQEFFLDILQRKTYIFGKLEKDLSLEYFREGCLHLSTSNPIWNSELQFFKKELLKKVNENQPKPLCKDIKITVELKKTKAKQFSKPKKFAKTLEDLVKQDILEKKEKGYVLCQSCGKMYVLQGTNCVFCESENIK